MPRSTALCAHVTLLILLACSPRTASAETNPTERDLAELMNGWRNAWTSTNSLALEGLEAGGTNPFGVLRRENILDWPIESRTLIASPTPARITSSGEAAFTFFQTNEALSPLGILQRSSFQVDWGLRKDASGWRIARVALLPVEPEALPPAIRAGEDDITLKSARRALREGGPEASRGPLDDLLARDIAALKTRSPFGGQQIRRQALWLRGSVDAALGRTHAAIPWWLEALGDPPRFPAASNALGDWFLSQGDLVQAVDHWRTSLNAFPEQPAIVATLEVHERALAHYADPLKRALFLSAVTGDPKDTIGRLTHLVTLDPANPETRRRLALAYLIRHDADTAHGLLEQNEYFHPGDLETRYLLARTAIIRERLEDALYWFAEVWRASPGYRDVITFLSELNASQGRYREAMAHLKDAIQRDPNDSMLLFKLGVYAAEIGDPEGARAWFGAAAKEGAPESIREELRRRLGRFGS